jgi:hypothetical protein
VVPVKPDTPKPDTPKPDVPVVPVKPDTPKPDPVVPSPKPPVQDKPAAQDKPVNPSTKPTTPPSRPILAVTPAIVPPEENTPIVEKDAVDTPPSIAPPSLEPITQPNGVVTGTNTRPIGTPPDGSNQKETGSGASKTADLTWIWGVVGAIVVAVAASWFFVYRRRGTSTPMPLSAYFPARKVGRNPDIEAPVAAVAPIESIAHGRKRKASSMTSSVAKTLPVIPQVTQVTQVLPPPVMGDDKTLPVVPVSRVSVAALPRCSSIFPSDSVSVRGSRHF